MSHQRDDGGGRQDHKRDRDDNFRDNRDRGGDRDYGGGRDRDRDGGRDRDRDSGRERDGGRDYRDRDGGRDNYNNDGRRDNYRENNFRGRGGGRGGRTGFSDSGDAGAYNPNFPTAEGGGGGDRGDRGDRGGRGGFRGRGRGRGGDFGGRPNNFNNGDRPNNPNFQPRFNNPNNPNFQTPTFNQNSNFNNQNRFNPQNQNQNQNQDQGAQKFRKLEENSEIVAPPVPAGEPEGYRLFVVCSKRASEDVIYDQFEVFGEMLSCKLLKDANGNSKGCAFITYAKKASAISAIEHMDGNDLYGQDMKVQFQVENQKAGVGGGYKPINRDTNLSVEEQLNASGKIEEEEPPLTAEEEAARQARVAQAVASGIAEAQKTQKEIADKMEKSLQGRQYNEDEYDY